ncbi:sodium ABC transporter ATP-binding protein [Methanolobus chelungpuianus]|uniref:Sodium ABC transporter ATP-binding protein n=1 Tax=Methanolobus chelungpuianus TaxID=502115 RepID=A0AAE3HCR6_9EURY|nr:sodium ABC transporter ATP-binding protein [Methanolobus chelungpuianus]
MALKSIDLEVKRGQSVVIFGPNGAGKTTFLKILSTVMMPTGGTVIMDGIDIKKKPAEVRRMIGVISHESYLYDELTARENLRFFGRMYGLAKGELEERTDELLANVDLLKRGDDRVGSFSRGMKQRLSIARALMHKPSVLLMDEPYTGLDQKAAETFESVMGRLDTDQVTKVMVSHNIERALQLSDRAIIMDNGKIVHDSPSTVFSGTEDFRHTYMSLVCGDTDAEGITNLQ